MARLQGGLRPPIPAGLPFGLEEYRRRHECVRAGMAAAGIDLLYVTSPANLFYLTGYEAIWYPNRLPVAVAVDRNSSELVVFDWTRHDAYVSTRVLCDEVVFLDYGRAPQMVADAFAQRGWSKRVIGIEWGSPNPSAPVMSSVADLLRQGGATIEAGGLDCRSDSVV